MTGDELYEAYIGVDSDTDRVLPDDLVEAAWGSRLPKKEPEGSVTGIDPSTEVVGARIDDAATHIAVVVSPAARSIQAPTGNVGIWYYGS